MKGYSIWDPLETFNNFTIGRTTNVLLDFYRWIRCNLCSSHTNSGWFVIFLWQNNNKQFLFFSSTKEKNWQFDLIWCSTRFNIFIESQMGIHLCHIRVDTLLKHRQTIYDIVSSTFTFWTRHLLVSDMSSRSSYKRENSQMYYVCWSFAVELIKSKDTTFVTLYFENRYILLYWYRKLWNGLN